MFRLPSSSCGIEAEPKGPFYLEIPEAEHEGSVQATRGRGRRASAVPLRGVGLLQAAQRPHAAARRHTPPVTRPATSRWQPHLGRCLLEVRDELGVLKHHAAVGCARAGGRRGQGVGCWSSSGYCGYCTLSRHCFRAALSRDAHSYSEQHAPLHETPLVSSGQARRHPPPATERFTG